MKLTLTLEQTFRNGETLCAVLKLDTDCMEASRAPEQILREAYETLKTML